MPEPYLGMPEEKRSLTLNTETIKPLNRSKVSIVPQKVDDYETKAPERIDIRR